MATRLAVEKTNQNSGLLGKPVELLEFYNQSTGLGSRKAARNAVSAKVIAVQGPSWSSHALAIAPVLQKNGIDYFYALRKIEPSLKIVLSSGFPQDADLEQLKKDGLIGYIRSPFDLEDLAQIVSKVL